MDLHRPLAEAAHAFMDADPTETGGGQANADDWSTLLIL